jgi:hypothetical protein
MNQTKKRLSIINLAISITDIETIQLQVLKLRLLKTDEKIQSILEMLQDENYAQAQALITTYIDTPNKEILQRTFQKEKEKKQRSTAEKATMQEFDLFSLEEDTSSETQTLDLDDMLRLESDSKDPKIQNVEEIQVLDLNDMLKLEEESKEEIPQKVHEPVDFESLLSVHSDDILPNNIKIDISHDANSDFWSGDASQRETLGNLPRDTFFDEETEEESNNIVQDDVLYEENISEPSIEQETTKQKIDEQNTFFLKNEVPEPTEEEGEAEILLLKESTQENTENENIEKVETEVQEVQEVQTVSVNYKAIPYIDQKLKNMQVQYPPVDESNGRFESVDKWLLKISNEGYTEVEVEEIIKKISEIRTEHSDEAAQLLLISAATESKYAQFILARTLYKGDILQKNLPEAFTLINRLAVNDDYPEAICDLAQFYEYGIGIDKDKEKAEVLYQEAMEAGIKRAETHFERLNKHNRGFFSFLSK